MGGELPIWTDGRAPVAPTDYCSLRSGMLQELGRLSVLGTLVEVEHCGYSGLEVQYT